MLPIFVSSSDLAKVLGISQRRIQQLANESTLFKTSDGKFELSKNIELYYTWKLKPAETANYEVEKALHEKAKREKAEMVNAKLRGHLHDAKDVEQVMTDMLVNFRSKLLGLPYNLASRLAKVKDVNMISSIIEKEIKDALTELSDYNPTMFAAEIEGVEDEEENS